MVKGVEDSTYITLKKRFDKLIHAKEKNLTERVDLDAVIDTILNKGLEKGILLYDKYKSS
jgi:hypothetical protein